MGVQPVALPTMLLSTHTGGLGEPARQDCQAYGHAALAHYRELGLAFDCIYTGYLGSSALVDLAAEAFRLWPGAFKSGGPRHGRRRQALQRLYPPTSSRRCAACAAPPTSSCPT